MAHNPNDPFDPGHPVDPLNPRGAAPRPRQQPIRPGGVQIPPSDGADAAVRQANVPDPVRDFEEIRVRDAVSDLERSIEESRRLSEVLDLSSDAAPADPFAEPRLTPELERQLNLNERLEDISVRRVNADTDNVINDNILRLSQPEIRPPAPELNPQDRLSKYNFITLEENTGRKEGRPLRNATLSQIYHYRQNLAEQFPNKDMFRLIAGKFWTSKDFDQQVVYLNSTNNINESVPFKIIFPIGRRLLTGFERQFLTLEEIELIADTSYQNFRDTLLDANSNQEREMYNPSRWRAYIEGSAGAAIDGNENPPIPSLFQQNKVFQDISFRVPIPFFKNELRNANASKNAYIDFNSIYNFYSSLFETFIINVGQQSVPLELVFPNLYVLQSQAATDNLISIFNDFITLNGLINNPQNKGIPDGAYYEEWVNAVNNILRTPANNNIRNQFRQLSEKYRFQIFNSENHDFFKNIYEKRFLHPTFNEIEISTPINTEFSQLLKEVNYQNVFIKNSAVRSDRPGVGLGFTIPPYHMWALESGLIDNAIVQRLNDKGEMLFRTWNITDYANEVNFGFKREWLDEAEENFPTNQELRNTGVLLGKNEDDLSFSSHERYELIKRLLRIVYGEKFHSIIERHYRTMEQVLQGKECYTETVFYKVSKFKVNETRQHIQDFYIPNSNDIDIFKFADTQIQPFAMYEYEVFAYQMVIGTQYTYSNLRVDPFGEERDWQTRPTGRGVKVWCLHQPIIKLVEVPITRAVIEARDKPPIEPNVSILPYKGINNKVLINLCSNSGEYKKSPILIEEDDQLELEQIIRGQNIEDIALGLIHYKSDDLITAFEVFKLESKPESYKDFAGSKIALIELDNTTSIGFKDDIKPNVKYYYTFRSIDVHGKVSYPTPVYEIELIDDQGTMYFTNKIINFEFKKKDKPFKTGRKYLKIAPAFAQQLLNQTLEQTSINKMNLDEIKLGTEASSVWGKNFKIRIRSKSTGKEIDINLAVRKQHIKPEEEKRIINDTSDLISNINNL